MQVLVNNFFDAASLMVDKLKKGFVASNNKAGWQLIRYLFTGGSAALIDWFIYWLLIYSFGFYYLVAAIISFTVATMVNYYLSANWVFHNSSKYSRTSEIILVFMVSLVGLLINQVCLYLLVEVVFFHLMWAKVSSTGVVFFWNFYLRKRYIFSHEGTTRQ
jgi:putative flippase GtrA